jgi:hypothetical protein
MEMGAWRARSPNLRPLVTACGRVLRGWRRVGYGLRSVPSLLGGEWDER